MADNGDHDLLIELKTLMTVALDNQSRQFTQMQETASKVAALEAKDRGDSERIGNILESVKATTNNSGRITEAHTRIDNANIRIEATQEALNKRLDDIAEEMKAMRSKSNVIDAINSVGVVVSGVIGSIFGSR